MTTTIMSRLRFWLVVAVAVAGAVLWGWWVVGRYQENMEQQFRGQAAREMDLIRFFVVHALQQEQYQSIKEFLREWGTRHSESVVSIRLTAANGFLLGSYERDAKPLSFFSQAVDVSYSYHGRARLEVVRDLLPLEREIRVLGNQIMAAGFIVLVVFVYILLINRRRKELMKFLAQEKEVVERAHHLLRQEMEERQVLQEALAQEKERLSVTLRSIGDAVIATDCDLKVVLMNRVAEKITGWRQEETLGRPFCEVCCLQDAASGSCRDEIFHKVVEQGMTHIMDENAVLYAKDGQVRRIADSAAPIFDRKSVVIGVVIVFRDISHELKVREIMSRAQKLESIGVLAGGIAHDFNNILTAIMGNVFLAKSSAAAFSSEIVSRLADAEKGCLRARELTQQLITFAKGGAPVTKPLSARSLLEEASKFALHGSHISCTITVADETRSILGDSGQLQQVLSNLIINATQAMSDGGTITLSAENFLPSGDEDTSTAAEKRSMVRIQVRDTGPGIPADVANRIFDPYFSTKKKGHGLGLAITHSIIAKHGGTITLEPGQKTGAVFTILLPTAEEDVSEATARQQAQAIQAAGGGRILVMDDDEMARSVFRQVLEHANLRVTTARDGEEAVALYQRAMAVGDPFDLVLLDLTIPGGMGGRETVTQLRKLDPKIRAIVSSGYSNDPILAAPREYGFLTRVIKPFQPEDLLRVVHDILRN